MQCDLAAIILLYFRHPLYCNNSYRYFKIALNECSNIIVYILNNSRFTNGYAYKYAEGSTLTVQQYSDPHVYQLVLHADPVSIHFFVKDVKNLFLLEFVSCE